MTEEQVDIVDERGVNLKVAAKSEAHLRGWLHKTVIGTVRRGGNWVLVRQADDRQDAGQLVNPVGGHVSAGEADEQALLRECEEEIGTQNVNFKLIGQARYHRRVIGRDENHLFVVFELTTDEQLVLNHEAVAVVELTESELTRELEENPDRFGDAFYFVAETFYPQILPKTYKKRWS